jgi:hypothetical protein
MRLFAAATTFFVALLVGAAAAPAADIGANDDAAKHTADFGLATYSEMAAVGLRRTVIGVRFRPSQAMVIQDKELLDRIVPNALAAGLRVVLALYPYPPREIEAGLGSPALFAGYVSTVARTYPLVTQFVIGNEPNQPAFWRPQFARSGANASAPAFGPYLAAAYDALKAIDSTLEVIGVGLSPRGNDKPKAKNNVSSSPIRFLRALGTWYRQSGRARPLMDSFSFHPYPNRATDSLDHGYPWPNAGFSDLDRVKQALWDAFDGTAQPTTLLGLRIHLDEVGWQVDTSRRSGYQGAENVPVTDELTQAAIYGDLIRRAYCDSDIASVSFFGFRDDGLRTGFQAALLRADGTPRPAVAAVQAAIAEAKSGCSDSEARWIPTEEVIDANVEVGTQAQSAVTARIVAGEDVRAVVCVGTLAARGIGGAAWRTLRMRTSRCQTWEVRGLRPLNVTLSVPGGEDVRGEVTVKLSAQSNRTRTTMVAHELPMLR